MKRRSGTRMEHCSYRHSDFYQLITLLMSFIESHLSNKPKQVFFNPIHIFDTFTYSITLLYIFNILFFNLTSIFLIYSTTISINVTQTRCAISWCRKEVDYELYVTPLGMPTGATVEVKLSSASTTSATNTTHIVQLG